MLFCLVSLEIVAVKLAIFCSNAALRLSLRDYNLLNSLRAADVAILRCISPMTPGGW